MVVRCRIKCDGAEYTLIPPQAWSLHVQAADRQVSFRNEALRAGIHVQITTNSFGFAGSITNRIKQAHKEVDILEEFTAVSAFGEGVACEAEVWLNHRYSYILRQAEFKSPAGRDHSPVTSARKQIGKTNRD